MVECERKIVEANRQAEIERKRNGLSQAYYQLASFFITDRGASRGEAAYRRVWSDDLAKGDARRIRSYLFDQVTLARGGGDKKITFRSGDVHKALGLVNSLPNVCQVLKGSTFLEEAGVAIAGYIECPPSGQGANLIIEFRIL